MRLLDRVGWVVWLAMLAVVPWTSSRYVVKLIGRTPVSPLALYPLGLLVLLWLLPQLLRGRRVPALAWPLVGLVFAALVSVAGAHFISLEPYKGQVPLNREMRGLVTLGIGVAFYLSTTLQASNDARLKTSLRALYLGAILTLIWGSVQAYFVLDGKPGLPSWLIHLHRQFVIRQPFKDRVTGLAFEPSWFADQMLVLYLPLWVGSVAKGYTVFTSKRRLISVELALALWGIALFLLTFSRGGYLTFFAILGLVSIVAGWRIAGRLLGWLKPRIGRPEGWKAAAIRGGVLAVALGLLAVMFGAVGVWVSERDRRMTSLRVLPSQMTEIRREHPGEVIYALADRLAFAERVVFWEAGYRPFELYPIAGVGLGNAGFLFPKVAPAYGYGLTEIRMLLDPANPNFPNPKNLWIRLLSETGILGFSFYLTWLLLLFAGALGLRASRVTIRGVLGTAGSLATAAILLEGFSLDTFALPQMWIILGFLSAAIGREPELMGRAEKEEHEA